MSAQDPEDINGDGNKDVWIDTDGDGIPDKIDFDGNGFADGALLDLNKDGVPDAISVYGMTNTYYLPTSGTRPVTSTTRDASSDTTATSSSIINTSPPARTPENTTGLSPGSATASGPAITSEAAISASSSPSSVPVGAIAGGAVGGLVAIAAILGFVWLIMRERRLKGIGATSKAELGGIETQGAFVNK
ncbi:hypothetical protein TWF281_011329 [Arthrobotrys megalospora]